MKLITTERKNYTFKNYSGCSSYVFTFSSSCSPARTKSACLTVVHSAYIKALYVSIKVWYISLRIIPYRQIACIHKYIYIYTSAYKHTYHMYTHIRTSACLTLYTYIEYSTSATTVNTNPSCRSRGAWLPPIPHGRWRSGWSPRSAQSAGPAARSSASPLSSQPIQQL